MTDASAETARLMNVMEAIVAELERQGGRRATGSTRRRCPGGDPGGRRCRPRLPGRAIRDRPVNQCDPPEQTFQKRAAAKCFSS